MPSRLVDLVKINVSNSGTGAITLGAAAEGHRGVEVLTNGVVYSYSIQQGGAWEFGRGTFLSDGNQLIRSVISSSDGGTPIALQATSQVAFTALAEDLANSTELTAEIQAQVDAAVDAAGSAAADAGVASTAATTATTQAGLAAGYAGDAADSAAQSALILDILNAIALGVAYANTTDGIAGTVDQEYFGVVSGQRAYVYLNDDGTAVLLYEISTAVNRLFSAIASVSIAAGEFLHIYNDGGVVTARKAIATLYPANAFAVETVLSGASCRCSAFGFNANVSVATMTQTVWLSPTVAGGFTDTAPTTEGQFVQPLGMAIPGAGIFFTPQPTVQL